MQVFGGDGRQDRRTTWTTFSPPGRRAGGGGEREENIQGTILFPSTDTFSINLVSFCFRERWRAATQASNSDQLVFHFLMHHCERIFFSFAVCHEHSVAFVCWCDLSARFCSSLRLSNKGVWDAAAHPGPTEAHQTQALVMTPTERHMLKSLIGCRPSRHHRELGIWDVYERVLGVRGLTSPKIV